jgi:nucleotide-binding universal stress UspA family protein
MSHRFASILLPLDGSPESAKAAGCALWLAQALGATLHVVHATAHSLPAAGALARLRVPHVQDARVVVHQVAGGAEAAVLQEIAAHHIDLVVMSARGESASAKLAPVRRLGSIAQAVIERSPVPIVLLPLHYRESLPWTSMLAAASGEASADHALEAAARLATALRLKITVVHSADGPRGTGAAPFGGYADAPHHEYSHRLKQLVERGLAGCAAEEAHCVHDVLLCRGEPGGRAARAGRRPRQQRAGAGLARCARCRPRARAQVPAGTSRMCAARGSRGRALARAAQGGKRH